MLAFGMGLSLAPGVISAQMVRENDFVREYAAMIGYVVFGALQLIVLARYGATIDWSEAGGWIYLLIVLSILAVGSYGWTEARRRSGLGSA